MLRPFKNLLSYIQKNTNGFNNSVTELKEMNDSNSNNCNSETSLGKKVIVENIDLLNKSERLDEEEAELDTVANPLENNFEKCHVISIDLDDSFEVQSESEEPEFEASDLLLNNDDLNNSFQSCEEVDPLRLLDISNDVNGNILESIDLTGPEAEENILCIIDVEQIKEQSIFLDEPDVSNNSIEPQNNMQIIGEEHEIRSDGSDSGLGSETSGNLQTSKLTSANVSINKTPQSNLKRRSDAIAEASTPGLEPIGVVEKRKKKSLHFNEVNVYYFPRIQGFGCVPSQGGCTLGMSANHINSKTFTLAEHAAEQRRAHKQQLQEINPKGSSSEESDSDDELSEGSGSDLDADTNGFLQPVTAKQRRALLKAAGVRKIDPTEKEDCRTIRSSREFCGCNCRGFCDPDTCACSQAGIKCQVDRQNFPCGCTRDGCANIYGRVEFNPDRVRRHYIHTITRLNLENKEQKPFDSSDGSGGQQTSHLLLGYNYNHLLDNNGTATSAKYYNAQTSQSYSNGALHHNLGNPTISSSFAGYSESIHLYSSYGEYNDVNYNSTFNTNYQNYENSNYFSSSYPATNLNQNSASVPSCNQIETYDLTSTDNTSNYTNLHTPLTNSMDEINDLLHNNRNTPPTTQAASSQPSSTNYGNYLEDPVPLHPTTIAEAATTCSLASSGQTSTSIIEGTSISITESVTSNLELEITPLPSETPIQPDFSEKKNFIEKTECLTDLNENNNNNDSPMENKTKVDNLLDDDCNVVVKYEENSDKDSDTDKESSENENIHSCIREINVETGGNSLISESTEIKVLETVEKNCSESVIA